MRKCERRCMVAAFSFFLAAIAASTNAGASQPRLIKQRVTDLPRVTLYGNTSPAATPINDRGRVADGLALNNMSLLLRRSPAQERELAQLIEDQNNPYSPNYHRWLTPQEFGARFGLAVEDVQATTQWLAAQGFKINAIYPNRSRIDFSGTAGQVRRAFRTEIHQLNVRGVMHIANVADPQIPAALAPAVIGVVSLHDFRPHPMSRPHGKYTYTVSSGKYYALVPADLAKIYNFQPAFNAGLTGRGQRIAVVEDTNLYSTADWSKFRSTFGLAVYASGNLVTQHPSATAGRLCSNPGVNSDDGEAILDAQWASAAAPNAQIIVASCANTATSSGIDIAIQNLINSPSPPAIISVSYGLCEAYLGAAGNAAYNAMFQQAAAEGISVFVSAGDEGAASCDAGANNATHGVGVSGLASTPYNVAVGGTDFGDTYSRTNSTYWTSSNTNAYGSARSYIPEIPWNDSCASTLIAAYVTGSPVGYGASGLCNTAAGAQFHTTASGSGGPSGCATGTPSSDGIVTGSCAGYPKPSWQSVLIGVPADGTRSLPDVSLFAADGVWGHYYVFCYSDFRNGGASCNGAPSTWAGAGGTSFGAPIMAGVQALVNQKKGRAQGNPNPVYYALAARQYGASGDATCNSTKGNGVAGGCVFYDVTFGDMDVNCTGAANCYRPSGTYGVLSTSKSAYQPAYKARVGWDFATGIGSVNVANLVNAWP